jgi:hypothetical protein
MREELLEAEAFEEPAPEGHEEDVATPRPLPARAESRELGIWRDEVRSAAIAAAGGLVAGAATVVAVRATRGSGGRKPAKRSQRRERPVKVLASRSFMVDVHLLDK